MTGRVRPAADADARPIAELHVRGWQWAYRGILPDSYLAGLSVDAREQMWLRRLADPDPRAGILVWDEDGRVRGFAVYGPARDELDGADRGKLFAIYLDQEVVGRGAGRALHDAAMDGLRAAGFGAAVLWVLESNARGRAFYERQGWVPDGQQKSYTFGDEQKLELRLARAL
jgi:GNAT superfamily N-acetyltransferase